MYQQCLKHIYAYCIVISPGCFVQKYIMNIKFLDVVNL
jgi:hypothetical protein